LQEWTSTEEEEHRSVQCAVKGKQNIRRKKKNCRKRNCDGNSKTQTNAGLPEHSEVEQQTEIAQQLENLPNRPRNRYREYSIEHNSAIP
jgi:hypothetical protein